MYVRPKSSTTQTSWSSRLQYGVVLQPMSSCLLSKYTVPYLRARCLSSPPWPTPFSIPCRTSPFYCPTKPLQGSILANFPLARLVSKLQETSVSVSWWLQYPSLSSPFRSKNSSTEAPKKPPSSTSPPSLLLPSPFVRNFHCSCTAGHCVTSSRRCEFCGKIIVMTCSSTDSVFWRLSVEVSCAGGSIRWAPSCYRAWFRFCGCGRLIRSSCCSLVSLQTHKCSS